MSASKYVAGVLDDWHKQELPTQLNRQDLTKVKSTLSIVGVRYASLCLH